MCYMDRHGDCYQNGKEQALGVPICKIPGNFYRIYWNMFYLGIYLVYYNVVVMTFWKYFLR